MPGNWRIPLCTAGPPRSAIATRVYYGSARYADNLLETQKGLKLELEARDGIRRYFEYDWTTGRSCTWSPTSPGPGPAM